MKMSNFRGELTEISSITEPQAGTAIICWVSSDAQSATLVHDKLYTIRDLSRLMASQVHRECLLDLYQLDVTHWHVLNKKILIILLLCCVYIAQTSPMFVFCFVLLCFSLCFIFFPPFLSQFLDFWNLFNRRQLYTGQKRYSWLVQFNDTYMYVQ